MSFGASHQRAIPAAVSQKLASMIGMSVNTFRERQASSKPRQFRAEAGRSRARVIRPSSPSATQASASPRGDSAQPSPVPLVRGSSELPAVGARVEEFADQPDGFGGLGEHDVEAGEHVARGAGGDGDASLSRSRPAGNQPRVGLDPGGAGDRADQAETAGLAGGEDAGRFQPVEEGVGIEQGVGGPLELAVRARKSLADRGRVGRTARAADPDHAEQVPVTECPAFSRSSRSRAISAADWPTPSPVDWHSAAIAAAWL